MGSSAVRLAEWRKQIDVTQVDLAERLGCSQSYVCQMERAVNPIIPGREIMVKIYRISGGAVTPNDFYDLPSLDGEAERKAA